MNLAFIWTDTRCEELVMCILRLSAAVLAALVFVGCWVPEDFVASLDINADKSFTFTYDGLLAFGPALAEIKARGRLSPRDEAELKKLEAELRKERGVQDVSYIGNGRYKLRYVMSGIAEPGTKVFLDLVKFKADTNGNLLLEGTTVPAEARRDLTAVGAKFGGTIKLKSALPILSENADAKPFFMGLFGSYKWTISMDRLALPRVVLGRDLSISSERTGYGALAAFMMLFLLLIFAALAAWFYMSRRPSSTGARYEFCGQCGHRLFSGARFCEECGVQVSS
jgi:hypothetical protein